MRLRVVDESGSEVSGRGRNMLGTWLKGDGGALERVGLWVCVVYDVVDQRSSFAASREKKRKRRMTDSLSWCDVYLVDGKRLSGSRWRHGSDLCVRRATLDYGAIQVTDGSETRVSTAYTVLPYTRSANNDNCHGAFENDGSWDMRSMELVCGPRSELDIS
jgi:hypothetical protein